MLAQHRSLKRHSTHSVFFVGMSTFWIIFRKRKFFYYIDVLYTECVPYTSNTVYFSVWLLSNRVMNGSCFPVCLLTRLPASPRLPVYFSPALLAVSRADFIRTRKIQICIWKRDCCRRIPAVAVAFHILLLFSHPPRTIFAFNINAQQTHNFA